MPKFSGKKLTNLISSRKKKMGKNLPVNLISRLNDSKNNIINQMYWPSKWSFFIAVFIVFIFYLLSHFGPTDYWLKFLDSDHYQNLIAIYAGISTIIFALIIFIAESSRDHRDKVRVLLKVSFLFPLLVVTIFGFFNFLWGNINYWSVLFILGIGFSVIFSASRLFLILLNKSAFQKEYINLLKDRFKKSIELAIDERLGYDILLEKLNDIELDYFFYVDDIDKYYCFYSSEEGIIADINLDKLAYFAKRVELEANKQDVKYPFDFDGRMEEFQLKYGQERYLCRTYKDNVTETDILLCFNKSLIKDIYLIKEFEKLVKEIFVITKGDNFSKQVRLDLKDSMEQFIDAIKNEKMSQIEQCSEIYQVLVETLLGLLDNYGIQYSFKRARKESVIAYKGSNEIRWLLDDIKEIFEVGIKSQNKKIIDELDLLVIIIVWKSISFNNHYVYQQLMNYFSVIYRISQEISTDQEKNKKFNLFMKDLSLSSTERTYDFIESKLTEKKQEKEDLVSLKDFAIYLLIIYQNILISTQKDCDFDYFKKLLNSINERFTRYSLSKEDLEIQNLELQLKDTEIAKNRINELEIRLEKNKLLKDIEIEIKNRKGQMIYGLAVDLFEKFKKHKNNLDIQKFYLELEKSFPNDLKKFTEIFLSSHTMEANDFWHWDFILEKIPEGKVWTIDVMSKLERYYVIKSLRILENITVQEIENINLLSGKNVYNRDLYFLSGETGLIKFIDEIEKNRDNWKFILSKNAFSRIDSFKKLLLKFKKDQDELDKENKRDKNISDKKVEEFKEQVLEGFNDKIIARNLIKEFDLYEKVDEEIEIEKNKLKKIGLKVVDDKAVFFEKWHVTYPRWGYEYGISMAITDDLAITKEIKNQCTNIKTKITSDNAMKMLNNSIDKFKDISKIVIFAINTNAYMLFENFESIYMTEPMPKLKGLEGFYEFNEKKIPVFEIYNNEIEKGIMIVNKNKLGKLVQYPPTSKKEYEKFIKDIFYINIESFSESKELVQKFLKNPPKWLENIPESDKEKELEESVLIYICEKFKYRIPEEFEGYYLRFK